MEREVLIAILLGFLVLALGVQALQLNGLSDKIEGGTITGKVASAKPSTTTGPAQSGNLPRMVGGG